MGLMPQDAYYFYYGQHLDWSYFDHPGMIGYFLRLFSELFGQEVWVVKFTDFTLSSLSLWAFYLLATQFLPHRKSILATFLFGSSLLMSMLSLNSTPDVPLVLFWTLSLFSLYKAVFKKSTSHWVLAGIFMGLAFNSKYTAILLPLGLGAFLLFSSRYRTLLTKPGPWVAGFLFLLISFPVYYWNEQHHWASFGFQTAERSSAMGLSIKSPKLFLGFITSQMVLVYPMVFIGLSVLSFKHLKKILFKRKLPSDSTLFLLAFFIPTFVGFFLLSPLYWIKVNWLVPSFLSGFILLAMFYKEKWIPTHLITALILHFLIAVEVITYVVPIRSDDTFWGWKELSQQVETLSKEHPDAFIFSADGYKTSAILQFHLPDKEIYSSNVLGDQGLQFSIIHSNLAPLNHRNAIFIDSDPRLKTLNSPAVPPKKLIQKFDSVVPLPSIELKNTKGMVLRKFNVYRCLGYRVE